MSKTRMIEAVKELDVDAVRDLLAAAPDLLRVTDRRGFNLLHLACSVPCADLGIAESRAAKMVSLLLDRGLDVESTLPPEQERCTALFFAVARGRNATLIKLLLKRGAKVQNAPAADYSQLRGTTTSATSICSSKRARRSTWSSA